MVRVKGSLPAPDGRVVREGDVLAEFWRPGRDPRGDAAQRSTPDHYVACLFDEQTSSWVTRASTAGWGPGTWTVRGRLTTPVTSGEPGEGWAWLTFDLAA